MPDETDIEVIAPDGDIILVVGDKKKARKKLRVSSHTLSSTSPVFEAMFGPHFSEGQQLNSAVPAEILLPEDDAKAMTLICRLLHCRRAPTGDEKLVDQCDMLDMALAIDKYQVVDVLHWQIRGVLSHWLSDFDDDNLYAPYAYIFMSTVAATYLLKCKDAYNRATAYFVNNSKEGIVELVDRLDIIEHIPRQVLLILEERRAAVRAKNEDVEDEYIAKDAGLCLHCSRVGKQHRNKKCVGIHQGS